MQLRTFLIVVEVIEVNFLDDVCSNIDVDVDTHEVLAIDETMAIEELRDKLCYRNEFGAKDIHSLQIHEVV